MFKTKYCNACNEINTHMIFNKIQEKQLNIIICMILLNTAKPKRFGIVFFFTLSSKIRNHNIIEVL